MLHPTEEFLLLVADTQGPLELIASLAGRREWLTLEFCASVYATIATKPWLRSLESRVREIELLIEAAALAASASDLADLVAKSEVNSLVFSMEMGLILAELDEGASERVQRLKSELQLRFDAVNKLGSGEIDNASVRLALDSVTIDALAVRARMELRLNRPGALELFSRCQLLEGFANQLLQLELSDAAQGPFRIAERRLTSGEAERMWLQQFVNPETMVTIVHDVRTGRRTEESALLEVQRLALETLDRALLEIGRRRGEAIVPARVTRDYALATAVAAFFVFASAEVPSGDQVTYSVMGFRALFERSWFQGMNAGERGAMVLRFALFVFQQKSIIFDARGQLEWVSEQMKEALAALDSSSHPGLKRDLRFARARALRELAVWEPALLGLAIDEFRLALSTRGARFDVEARGRGLMDLASALHASQLLDARNLVDGLYREALALLTCDDFPISRATALLGYAIVLNERRTEGDQELALSLLDEAVDLTDSRLNEAQEYRRDSSLRLREQLASIHMTRGNVLRSAPSLEEQDGFVTDTALAAYMSALAVLQGGGNRPLKALVRLNMAHLYMDDVANEHRLGLASHNLDEARLLANSPRDLAIIALARARLLLETPHSGRGADVELLVQEVTQAVVLLSEHGEFTRAADAALKAARLSMDGSRPSASRLATAREVLERGLASARRGASPLLREILAFQAKVIVFHAGRSVGQMREQAYRRAISNLEEAIRLPIDCSLVRGSVEEALQQHDDDARLAADIVWLKRELGESPTRAEVSRALSADASFVAPQLSGHGFSGDPGTEAARRAVLVAERQVWGNQGHASFRRWFGTELKVRVEEWSVALAKRYLSAGMVAGEGAGRRTRNDDICLSFLVSEWGGLAIIDDARAQAPKVISIPLSRTELIELLWGTGTGMGWVRANRFVDGSIDLDPNWQAAFEHMLRELENRVWRPLRESGLKIDGRVVRVVPGALRSLPLHAVDDPAGGPVILRVMAWEYVSHERKRSEVAVKPKRARLALSDAGATHATLPASVVEIATIARGLAKRGMQVEVTAQSGPVVGASIFDAVGLPLPPEVGCSVERPTSERLVAMLTTADLFLFSGHGTGHSRLGGTLLLADMQGMVTPFNVLDAAAGPPMPEGAIVILSACETAWDIDSPAPSASSIASAFLKLGADTVLAGMWRISDVHAASLTMQFCDLVADGVEPGMAIVDCIKSLVSNGAPRSRWAAFCILSAGDSGVTVAE